MPVLNPTVKAKLDSFLAKKDTDFSIKQIIENGRFIGLEFNFSKFLELVIFLNTSFGSITVPKNTLIFHSNQFFSAELNKFEPIGTSMKIQDIRRYGNKGFQTTFKYPYSQMMARVYANFTPAGNTYVAGNYSVAESVYETSEDLIFLQLPYIQGYGHMKNVFDITNSRIFKDIINYVNKNHEPPIKVCGFILSTAVDETHVRDTTATRLPGTPSSGQVVYPELLILDGFDKFIKKAQYDLYDIDDSKKTMNYIHDLIDNSRGEPPKFDIGRQLTYISSQLPYTAKSIGTFGTVNLLGYVTSGTIDKIKDIPYVAPVLTFSGNIFKAPAISEVGGGAAGGGAAGGGKSAKEIEYEKKKQSFAASMATAGVPEFEGYTVYETGGYIKYILTSGGVYFATFDQVITTDNTLKMVKTSGTVPPDKFIVKNTGYSGCRVQFEKSDYIEWTLQQILPNGGELNLQTLTLGRPAASPIELFFYYVESPKGTFHILHCQPYPLNYKVPGFTRRSNRKNRRLTRKL